MYRLVRLKSQANHLGLLESKDICLDGLIFAAAYPERLRSEGHMNSHARQWQILIRNAQAEEIVRDAMTHVWILMIESLITLEQKGEVNMSQLVMQTPNSSATT